MSQAESPLDRARKRPPCCGSTPATTSPRRCGRSPGETLAGRVARRSRRATRSRWDLEAGARGAQVSAGRSGGRRRRRAPARHVHSHNLETLLTGVEGYRLRPRARRASARGRGRPASRAIAAPTAGSARATRSGSCRRSAASPAPPSGSPPIAHARHAGAVDGVYAFAHPHGCSQLGEDLDGTRVAARRAGLPSQCRRRAADRPGLRIEPARPADRGNSRERCAAAVRTLAARRARRTRSRPASPRSTRSPRPPRSARASLPARRPRHRPQMRRLGRLFRPHRQPARRPDRRPRDRQRRRRDPDRDPRDLRRRAAADGPRRATPRCSTAWSALVNDFKRYFLDHGQPVSENPSPGNIAGGITTLEEKSLGAVQKAGRAPVADVLRYGERRPPHGPVAARGAGQRRRLLDRAGGGGRDPDPVHHRPRHAARLPGADREDRLQQRARRAQAGLDRFRRRHACSPTASRPPRTR